EKDFPGFQANPKLNKLGMRGCDTSQLIFDNCIVPKENLLGKCNDGLGILMSGLDYERAILSAGPLGLMEACLDVMLPYVKQRKQFKKSLGEFQLIQEKIANAYTYFQASQHFVYAIAALCDSQKIKPEQGAAAYLFAAENATKIALDTIQCLGGNGYLNDFPAGRLLRDAKLYEIGAGTSEIRKIVIARELLKKD
ncbi:MAG: acyl-CoA dehydrogenase family protein, partial [Gammaproteobacteria bacterium]|nr:acyl-CoA dehydrogenase family protein [Gammaproteobacteria bacterium]